MGNERIRALLAELHDEIHKTEVDADTQSLMRELDADIHGLITADNAAAPTDTMLQNARELEGAFLTSHPTAARLLTEVMNTLAKMGI